MTTSARPEAVDPASLDHPPPLDDGMHPRGVHYCTGTDRPAPLPRGALVAGDGRSPGPLAGRVGSVLRPPRSGR